jgi:hypothetical protein
VKVHCAQSRAGVDPQSLGVAADSASFAIEERGRGARASQFDQRKNEMMYFGITTTHRRLFQYELSGFNSPEQKIEDFEDEGVPAVERGVAGRAGGDGEKKIKEAGFGKSADESAL